jgi:hypothetical protein
MKMYNVVRLIGFDRGACGFTLNLLAAKGDR